LCAAVTTSFCPRHPALRQGTEASLQEDSQIITKGQENGISRACR
jgi:hypothetical protein